MLAGMRDSRQKVPQRLARDGVNRVSRPAAMVEAQMGIRSLCCTNRETVERGDIPAHLDALGRGQSVGELLSCRRLCPLFIGKIGQKLPQLRAEPIEADLSKQCRHFAPPERGAQISRCFARGEKANLQIIEQVAPQSGRHGVEVGLGKPQLHRSVPPRRLNATSMDHRRLSALT